MIYEYSVFPINLYNEGLSGAWASPDSYIPATSENLSILNWTIRITLPVYSIEDTKAYKFYHII